MKEILDNDFTSVYFDEISNSIIESINKGELEKGQKLPSINEICSGNDLARETVVKAFSKLREKGLVTSIHGKGFYVSSTNTKSLNRTFVLFDTFTSYKETLYFGLQEGFEGNAHLDLYFHHFNFEVFKSLILNNAGDYTYYVIIPINHKQIATALSTIPSEKLYLLDIKPDYLRDKFVGVYQDFEQDVKQTLSSIHHLIQKYSSLTLVFRNTITDVPKSLEKGFREYCLQHNIIHKVKYDRMSADIKKGEAYIVIDDDDLVSVVESAGHKGLEIGRNIGIISYNDTPLKKVVKNGISVISTDFKAMGKGIAEMILNHEHDIVRNKTTFVNRGSF